MHNAITRWQDKHHISVSGYSNPACFKLHVVRKTEVYMIGPYSCHDVPDWLNQVELLFVYWAIREYEYRNR